jgi:hypothetical protein
MNNNNSACGTIEVKPLQLHPNVTSALKLNFVTFIKKIIWMTVYAQLLYV